MENKPEYPERKSSIVKRISTILSNLAVGVLIDNSREIFDFLNSIINSYFQ